MSDWGFFCFRIQMMEFQIARPLGGSSTYGTTAFFQFPDDSFVDDAIPRLISESSNISHNSNCLNCSIFGFPNLPIALSVRGWVTAGSSCRRVRGTCSQKIPSLHACRAMRDERAGNRDQQDIVRLLRGKKDPGKRHDAVYFQEHEGRLFVGEKPALVDAVCHHGNLRFHVSLGRPGNPLAPFGQKRTGKLFLWKKRVVAFRVCSPITRPRAVINWSETGPSGAPIRETSPS